MTTLRSSCCSSRHSSQRSSCRSPRCVSRALLVLVCALVPLVPWTGGSVLGGAVPTEAATLTFTVNSTADAPDAHPGDGVCATAGGTCTLRAAIQEADAQPSGSSISINVPSGTYTLTLGTLQLTDNQITLTGALSSTTTINGNNSSTVLAISPTVQATISRVTISGGNTPGNGGGIANSGTLTLINSTVSYNLASYYGGGIYNHGGILTLTNSTISGNTAFDGGGIFNGNNLGDTGYRSTVTLTNSTVSSNSSYDAYYGGGGGIYNGGILMLTTSTVSYNSSSSFGGGIYNSYVATLTLTTSTLSGNSAGLGGGICNDIYGTVTVTTSTVSGNGASEGGGIENYGTLTVTTSTISSNSAIYDGGGIYNDAGGTLTLTSSTVSGNSASSSGGGIQNTYGTVTLSNSTLSGNLVSYGYGGGIFNGSSMTLTNSTLISNSAPTGGGIANQGGQMAVLYSTLSHNTAAMNQGGGIFNDSSYGGTIVLTGTILSTNVPGGDCRGPITESLGYNLDSADSCGFSRPTDLSDTLPHLGLLRDNGGPTETMSLEPGSPAIDHGGTHATGCPATDQRGLPRPDEASDQGRCDMGAYESQGVG